MILNDLISRRKVEEVISALVHEEGVTDDAAVLGCMAWNAVHTMEAVDAAPVVHGRWKYFHKQNAAVCLNCSFERDLDANFGSAVACPNCGVRMHKEKMPNE